MQNEKQQFEPGDQAGKPEDALLSSLLDDALRGQALSKDAKARLIGLGAGELAGLDSALAGERPRESSVDGLHARIVAETTPAGSPMVELLDRALVAEPMSEVGLGRLHASVKAEAAQLAGNAAGQASADDVALAGRAVVGRIDWNWRAVARGSIAAALLVGVMGWVSLMLLEATDAGRSNDGMADRGEAIAAIEAELESISLAMAEPVRHATERNLDALASDIEVTLIDYELEGLVNSEELDVDQGLDALDGLWLSDADLF
jgi:hypothetical protein